jgi:small subunit ribosomal protein S1
MLLKMVITIVTFGKFRVSRQTEGSRSPMSDQFNPDNDEKEESFATLLDRYSPGINSQIQIGDKLHTKIISIGKDTVFVDTGTKIDGVVEKVELLDDNQQMTLQEGDAIELYVIKANEDEIRLSKAVSGIGGRQMLREAFEKAIPVEGKINETCKGGFHVEVLKHGAFCPISQVDINYVEDPSEYVGKTYNFLIAKFEGNGKNIVLSRRVLLAQALEETRKAFYDKLTVDTVLDGTVTRLMPYGVFVEISAAVEGMVHVSELSWSKVATPESVVKVGDKVSVKVIGIEPGGKPGQKKIALSMKQLAEDPWINAGDKFQEGDKTSGTVTRCANFGAFVEISPGIEGLVHISEMSYKKRVLKPEDVVTAGDTVSVMIKALDLDKRRISLSIRDAEGDPWIGVSGKYSPGQPVDGILEKKEKFGYFITLEPGITGLLPKSYLTRSYQSAMMGKLREGDTLAVVVEAINSQDRKITLTPGNTEDERNWQQFAGDSDSSVGSLGEKLQQALESKNNFKK